MKPTVKFSPLYGSWVCACNEVRMLGATPVEAYERWITEAYIRAVMAAAANV